MNEYQNFLRRQRTITRALWFVVISYLVMFGYLAFEAFR